MITKSTTYCTKTRQTPCIIIIIQTKKYSRSMIINQPHIAPKQGKPHILLFLHREDMMAQGYFWVFKMRNVL